MIGLVFVAAMAMIFVRVPRPPAAERKRLFADAQRIFAEEQPVLYFAAPRIMVAMSRRVANAQPSVMKPNLLWNPDLLAHRMAVGFGFPDTVASWGTMLQEASNVSEVADFPWVLVPAPAIFVVMLSVNLIVQPGDTISQEASLRTGASHRGLSRATLPD